MKYLDHHKTKECSLAGNIFTVAYWQDIHYLLMCASLWNIKMVSIYKKVDTLQIFYQSNWKFNTSHAALLTMEKPDIKWASCYV